MLGGTMVAEGAGPFIDESGGGVAVVVVVVGVRLRAG